MEKTDGDQSDVYFVKAIQEYLGVSPEEARDILLMLQTDHDGECHQDADTNSSSSEEQSIDNIHKEEDADDDDEEELIGKGECELCERLVVLKKHHLIPKATHARIETKLIHACTAIELGEIDRAHRILGPGLEHVTIHLQANTTTKSSIRRMLLMRTCNICRPCHSAIHNTHDNMTLALSYNTVEQLLQDEQIYKFCHWRANKSQESMLSAGDEWTGWVPFSRSCPVNA